MRNSWTYTQTMEFASLLKIIIGNQSGKEFSKVTGIATSRISRLLNGQEQCPPTMKTIDKILVGKDSVNGVTREELLTAAGRIKNEVLVQKIEIRNTNNIKSTNRRQHISQYTSAISSVCARDWGLRPKFEKKSTFSLQLEKMEADFKWFFLVCASDQNVSIEKNYIRRMAGVIAEFPISNSKKYTYFTTNANLFLQYFNKNMPAIPALNANLSILYLDEEKMIFAEHILAETNNPSDDVKKHHF